MLGMIILKMDLYGFRPLRWLSAVAMEARSKGFSQQYADELELSIGVLGLYLWALPRTGTFELLMTPEHNNRRTNHIIISLQSLLLLRRACAE